MRSDPSDPSFFSHRTPCRRTSRSETPKTLSGALRSMASGQSYGSRDSAGSGASASKGSAVPRETSKD